MAAFIFFFLIPAIVVYAIINAVQQTRKRDD